MIDPLSPTLPSSPAGLAGAGAGLAGSLAGESTPAATGFDALLSAQLVAAAPANPQNFAVSTPSAVVAAAPGGASPTPVAVIPPLPGMAEQLGQMAVAAAPVAAVAQPLPAAAPAAAAPVAVPAEAAPAELPVAVAGKLPETGKPLPARQPRAMADKAAPAVAAKPARDDEAAPAGDKQDAPAPIMPGQIALPIVPALVLVSTPLPPATRTDAPAPVAARGPAKAATPIVLDAAASRARVPAEPAATAPDALTATPVPAGPVPGGPVPGGPVSAGPAAAGSVSPAAARRAPAISGIAVTIAGTQPTPVQAPPQPAGAAAATPTISPVATIAIADAQTPTVPAPTVPAPTVQAALLPVARAEAPAAAPREYAVSTIRPTSLASPSPDNEGKSAAPGGQGDLGHGQPPMADPSLTSPAGPSPVVSPEATSGPATLPFQQITPLATPLPQPVAVTPAAHDMSALVDRLVEARAAARTAASPMTVTTAVRHAEFGSVSLKFDTAGDGLSVTMASNDPGFAPAAQAALASQVAPATTADTTGQQNPQRQHAPDQPSAFQSGNATTGGFAQNQQQPQGQQTQPGFAAATRQPARPGNSSTGAETAADPSTHQSGVFA